jgi:pimeloyl-ACP methyl ester carboxylesterase
MAQPIDLGTGTPLVVIPGIDGRCERILPTLEVLAQRCRVLSFSLCGERTSGLRIDPRRGFDSYLAQLDRVLDRAGLAEAFVCGVSYGGWIGLRYAAERPQRVRGLILVAAPGPSWTPDRRARICLRAPRLLSPYFLMQQPGKFRAELAAAFPGRVARMKFALRQVGTFLRAPFSPTLMAERVRLASVMDFKNDCARVNAPTLVITGEPGLDRIVPADGTREYATAIRRARQIVLERTGHIGFGTRPERFAEILWKFLEEHDDQSQDDRSAWSAGDDTGAASLDGARS